jgi:hypothetical protein
MTDNKNNMKNFDFYEFAGVLTPGALLLYSISLIYPSLAIYIQGKEFTVGELGLFVILSYVAGHLLQALGNLIEWLYWNIRGGMPTDWVRTHKKHERYLISDQQIDSLEKQMQSKLKLTEPFIFSDDLTKKNWTGITRQIYAAVQAGGRSQRIDTFNGNYGLFRGIASAFLAALILLLVENGLTYWKISLLLVTGIAIAVFRMDRFGKYYAREVFIQFLQLPESVDSVANKKD